MVKRQSSSVQSFDRLGRRGDIRDESVEIFFQSFMQEEVILSGSGKGRDVHSLMLTIQLCLSRARLLTYTHTFI